MHVPVGGNIGHLCKVIKQFSSPDRNDIYLKGSSSNWCNTTPVFVPSFSIQAENEMSIEDLIAKYGYGGGAEEVEDNADESETEVEDEGMTYILFSCRNWM